MSTRDQLIDATRGLLWEQGYTATSPRDIQQRAGAGQGSMYHHFTGKVDLASEALRVTGEEMIASMRTVLEAEESPAAAVQAYLARPRDGRAGCRMGRMAQEESIVSEEVLRAPVAGTLQWYRDELQALLTQAQEAGQLRDDFDCSEVAATFVAIVQGAHVLSRADQSQDSFDTVIRGALTLLAGLRRTA